MTAVDRPLTCRLAGLRLLWLAAVLGVLTATGVPARALDFDSVAAEAAALARADYRAHAPPRAQPAALNYDDYRSIRFRPEKSLWRDTRSLFQVQFFPLGRHSARPLRLFEVVDGKARPLVVPASAFVDDRPDAAASSVPAGAAGWRLTFPLHDPGKADEVIAFLGASYFRALGEQQRYGASARGLAIDTVGAGGEEFPAFTTFWLEQPKAGSREMTFYALLDGPRVAGAYHFVVQPGATTLVNVRARLYLRDGVKTLGIAPLSSMFLSGENQPGNADFRPEVHDSDGLLIETGGGERIWRALTNPARPFVTSFAMDSLRGFGLMQRDRAFTSYEDLEAHYERRPSVWIQPQGDWGAGRVELLQFATPDETHDNIAAYWVPQREAVPGVPLELAWRLHWTLGDPPSDGLARVTQTRRGHGYREEKIAANRLQFHVDFAGPALPEPADAAALEVLASGNANVRALRTNAYPNTVRGGWRVSVDLERIDAARPVELRMQLRRAGKVISETWSYALAPE